MIRPQKILIVRLSSLGDILHVVPALQSLRNAFPDAQIDWLVEKRMQFLLAAIPGISGVLALDTQSLRLKPASPAAWKELLGLLRRIRATRYDLALDFQGLIKTALLTRMSRAATTIGYGKDLVRERPAHRFYDRTINRPSQEISIVRLHQLLAHAAGGHPIASQSPLNASQEDWRAVESLLKVEQLSRYIIINPGGGWPTKRWKPAKYGALAARVQRELKLSVIVTTAPGEENLYREICNVCPESPPRHFPVPFLQLIPLCLKALLFVGGDTGPFHLACALGTPVVGIFGPTSPVRNGPVSEQDETVVLVLECSFCYGRSCPTQNECMDITVEEVFAAIVRRLSRIRDQGSGIRGQESVCG